MKKPSNEPIWHKTARIELKTRENRTVYTLSGTKRGKLVYFLADYKSKEPLSRLHFDENDEIIAELPPQIYDGKFGPGVLITD